MEQPEKVYLRGQVYDTYTGTGWKTADTKDADTGSIELTYTVHVQKSDPIQLTIQTTPAEAIIFLTNDLNGKRIVEKNGTYSLTPGASYSYTTTCTGYIGQKVEHYTAPDKDGTLTITLEKAPANGTLASTDAAIVYRYANGKYQLSANQLLAADVNGDGVVNSTDAALIYRMANGKLLKFPVEKEKQSEQTTD